MIYLRNAIILVWKTLSNELVKKCRETYLLVKQREESPCWLGNVGNSTGLFVKDSEIEGAAIMRRYKYLIFM